MPSGSKAAPTVDIGASKTPEARSIPRVSRRRLPGNQALLRLQRAYTRSGTSGMKECPACHAKSWSLQTKLTVNEPGDMHEREADRVAEQVLGMPALTIQGRCACGSSAGDTGECAACRQTRAERMQRAATPPGPLGDVPPIVHGVLRSPGQPLDAATRTFMESRFGYDFSGVRVHVDARAAESARAVSALAYTVGQDVVFGAEQYAPRTAKGKRLLAHELTHVLQQNSRVAKSLVLQRETDGNEKSDCGKDFKFEFTGVLNNEQEKDHRGVPRIYYATIPTTKNTKGVPIEHLEAPGTAVDAGQTDRLNLWRAVCHKPTNMPRQILWVLNEYISRKSKPQDVDVRPHDVDVRPRRQMTRLELIRRMQSELATEFALIDAALPDTKAYEAYKQVRDNVMTDKDKALSDAEAKLSGADRATDAGAIQADLEQAELWLFFVQIYAHLAALIRSAETDRLVPDVIKELAAEARSYEQAFILISEGKPTGLTFARKNAVKQAENTKTLLTDLDPAIKEGKHAVETAQTVEAILDVPIQFASGATLPPQWLFLIFAVDKAGFYSAHKKQLDILKTRGYDFLAQLAWLELNAPLTKTHILNPIFTAIGMDSVKSVTAADVAFILGRTIYNIKKSAGKLSFLIAVKALAKATIIVGILDSPKLAVHGIGKLATRTKESVLQAIGGTADPHGIIQEINEQLGTTLSPLEAAALLVELTTPRVEHHVKLLTTAGADISPIIAAILADLEGTGTTTSAALVAAQAVAYALLPPAP